MTFLPFVPQLAVLLISQSLLCLDPTVELWAEGLCLLTQPVGANEIPPLWNTATVARQQPYTTGNRLGDSVTEPSQREHSVETGSPKVQQGAVL